MSVSPPESRSPAPEPADGPPCFGVDVVDLDNPRTRGRHLDRKFMSRIFGEAERALVVGAPDPERAVWRHWAAKEAAFKAVGIHRHPDAPPTFEHTAFEVVRMEAGRGRLRWHDLEFDLRIRTGPAGRRVAVVAGLDRLDPDVEWSASDTEETAVRLGLPGREALAERLGPHERIAAARGHTHGIVRLAVRTAMARRLDLEADRLEVVNAPGPVGRTPALVHLDGAPFPGARVSLSHDGARLAWASWVVSARTDGS